MKKIIIDLENCKSTDEIRNLIKKNLNLIEWNENNPDVLLKILRELEQCRIYFRGANLVPANISKYIKQIIDIFDKVEELYNNIDFHVMDVVTIDFTGIKSIYEAH